VTERAKLLKAAKALEKIDWVRTFRAFEFWKPYPKQLEFFSLGNKYTERMFFAGNQLGKTEAGAFEAACHMTGLYPEWWTGKRWDRPTRGWLAGETSLLVRDVSQRKLCGEPGVDSAFGSGMIPKGLFVDRPSLARGITDAFDTIQVRHVSGGTSVGRFKSYEQGRAKFQGETLDWFWCDEEPDLEIYIECITRITATNGMGWTTFTPLQGKTPMVRRFMDEDSPQRVMLTMTIDDVPMTPERRAEIIANYPAHMRKAKAYGVPLFGEGLVFDIAEEMITEPRVLSVPNHWPKLWGVDFGIGHPFAAVLGAWDRDADVVHLLHAFRMRDCRPLDHARAMRPFGDIIVAYPRDGVVRDKGSGIALSKLSRDEGVRMMHDHAQWPDGNISTEVGIEAMRERFSTGRLKVAAHLTDWFEEFRTYHRKDGQLVKQNDDLMSATRILIMGLRFATVSGRPLRNSPEMQRTKLALNTDLQGPDLF
jgi:phage terminase large subunit-like protein